MKITAWTNEEYARKHYIDPSDERLKLLNTDKKMITPNELKELAETDGISVEEEYEKWNQEFEKIPTFTDEKKAKELMQIYKEMEQTVIEHCKENGIRFSGDYHQSGDYGIPIIDDKYMFFCTLREWGYVMAQADENEDERGYLNYYLYSKNYPCKYPNEIESEILLK